MHFSSHAALAAVIAIAMTGCTVAPIAPPTAVTPQAPTAAVAVPPAMPDLARARPRIRAISAEEIDRVSGRSGLTDCFWTGTVSKGTFNILIPDTGVVYWLAQFRIPEGAKLKMEGQYPHGRYLSFNSYNPIGQPVDGLNDQMIAPSPGSTNPFIPGANRDSSPRNYSFQVVPRKLQAGVPVDAATRPGNTLFVPTDDKLYQLWMRVYLPDHGRDAKGGVPLPHPVLTLANGRELRGEALCHEIVVKDGSVKDYRADADGVRHTYQVPGARAPFHPAQPVPPWGAFYNPVLGATAVLVNTPFEALRGRVDISRTAGFYSTLDNRYMTAYVDNRYGDLLVIRAKAPQTPRTQRGAPMMDANVDMRYWSLCQYRSTADGAVDDCLYDEQVPADATGRYTIVIAPIGKRPANARTECGVAWLPWGAGDGIGNPHGGFLALRHMMVSPEFTNSLWATQKPGDERRALGEYFPSTTYEARTDFEARGCPIR